MLELSNTRMAERAGFEPADEVNPVNGLASRRIRPLCHLSAPRKKSTTCEASRQAAGGENPIDECVQQSGYSKAARRGGSRRSGGRPRRGAFRRSTRPPVVPALRRSRQGRADSTALRGRGFPRRSIEAARTRRVGGCRPLRRRAEPRNLRRERGKPSGASRTAAGHARIGGRTRHGRAPPRSLDTAP